MREGCDGNYDADLNPQITSFKLLRYPAQQAILERFLELELDPDPDWVIKPDGYDDNIREFVYDDEAIIDKPLAVRYAIDRTKRRIYLYEIIENERIRVERREIRFFALNGGTAAIIDFLKKTLETGGKETVGSLIALFVQNKYLGWPDTERLGGGLHQLRDNLGNLQYRIFYGYEKGENPDGLSIVLNGVVKSKKEQHQREMEKARNMLKIAHRALYENTISWKEAEPLLSEFLKWA